MKKTVQYTVSLILFLIVFIISGFAQTGIIKGKIMGKGEALASATISLGNKSLVSDQQGEFLFSVSSGNYKLIITHAGFKKIEQEIEIDAHNIKTIDFIMTPIEQMGEVVVLGSRSTIERTNLNTPVPVDVISANHLVQTGQASLTQMLNYTVPSFNASRQTANEPITLRGLDPDHVLILVNGCRYHNLAYTNDGRIRGVLGRGSVANNLNSIPFAAIEKIEILRDGAAAQYGSDAIAGVINIILKKTIGKTSVQLHSGQFYKGDGENISFGVSHGISLNKKGILNFSGDFQLRNPTFRGGKYKGTVYYNIPPTASPLEASRIRSLDDSICKARNFNRNDVSNARNSYLRNFGIVMNGGYPIGNKTELFWTAAWNDRRNIFISGYRFPKNNSQVNTVLFPDGFKAHVIPNSREISGIAGVNGETKNKWHWEYNNAYGNNTIDYHVENTNNASQEYTLGKNAPTSFYTGTITYQQLTNNIHLTKNFSNSWRGLKSLNIGFGAEWRLENFQTKAGEEISWQNYDTLGRKQGGTQNGLVFQPEDEVNEKRNVGAAYIDVETEFTDNFLIGAAGRYEYYNDFGGNLAGKLAARYKISDQFSLRGSLSNGFRAPGLQQRFYTNTIKTTTNVGGLLVPVISGIFRNNSEIAMIFGVSSLQAEKSVNLGGGFTASLFKHISLTVDAYWVQLKNRIVLSGSFDRRTNNDADSLLASYKDIDRVQFFSNAINTRTRGIDIVLNGYRNIKKGNLRLMLAANFSRTRLFGKIRPAENLSADSLNTNTLFNREEKERVERGQPSDKIILSVNYKVGKLGFLLRNTRFGKAAIVFDSRNIVLDQSFAPKILTDISINYSPMSWLTITAGSNNILDVYPDRIRDYRNSGEGTFIYAQEATPFGYNGGYYFVSMSFNF